MNCKNCGAALPLGSLQCPYCMAATPTAEERVFQEQHERAEAELIDHQAYLREAEARARGAEAEVARASKRAIGWALAGLVFFGLPAIAGLVFALRARRIARDNKLFVPSSASAGLALAAVEIALLGSFIVLAVVLAVRTGQRKDLLSARLDQPARAEQIAQSTACDLVELRLLADGYGSNANIHEFECPGKVVQTGDRAELDDVSFKVGGGAKKRTVATACFKRGARWTVDRLHEGKGCDLAPRPQ